MESKRILIVEDSPTQAKTLEIQLQKHNFLIELAMNGEIALEKLKENIPDLILLDILLPGINGYEVCKKIKNDNSLKKIPIIFLTIKENKDDIIKGLSVGANDYILKPFEPEELLARIKTQLRIKKLNDDIEDANQKLLEFDKRKSEFVNKVSHEIISPLSIIKQSIEIILKKMTGPINKEQMDILQTAENEVDSLVTFAKNLLNLSKIEHGKIKLEKKDFDIEEIIDEILDGNKIKLDEKNIATEKLIDKKCSKIFADPNEIKIAISNLIVNAIKYMEKAGKITIKISCDDDYVLIEIKDDGPGIEKEKLKTIFDKFERVTFATSQEGFGLGLSICREIILLHNGKIWVKSIKNKGTTFYISLPK